MSTFRVLFKLTVKEDRDTDYLSQASTFVELARNTEPGILQCEAFYHAASRNFIFLQSYRDAGAFDVHLSNPDIQALEVAMSSMADLHICRFFGTPTANTIAAFDQWGVAYEVLHLLQGSDRLWEAGPDEPKVQVHILAEASDLEAFLAVNAVIEDGAACQDGILYHRGFSRGGNKLAYLEGFQDQDKLLQWLASSVVAENFPKLGPLFKGPMEAEVMGLLTGAAKAALEGMGAVFYEPVAGFSRFHHLNAHQERTA